MPNDKKIPEYEVRSNTCNCHPETCCCDPWAVFHNDEKHSTHFRKEAAEQLAELLNQQPGKLHAQGTMFLRQHIATAEATLDGVDVKFEISMVNFTTPAVYCPATDRFFTLSLQDLLTMAIKAGIAK